MKNSNQYSRAIYQRSPISPATGNGQAQNRSQGRQTAAPYQPPGTACSPCLPRFLTIFDVAYQERAIRALYGEMRDSQGCGVRHQVRPSPAYF